ncbi:MAG: hypothetical protein CFE44_02025, partial [Burkholderiales bacterium PBB4]
MNHFTLQFLKAWARCANGLSRFIVGPMLIACMGMAGAHSAMVQTVAMGFNHTLAIRPDGSLWAWGDNRYGQLGNGRNLPSASPVKVGSGFAQVAAAGNYSLAIKSDGSLW